MKKNWILTLTVGAMLVAVGFLIPVVSPIKVVMPPASFTLASHVAIFIAMMINPWMAGAVAVLTTAGFAMGGFPIDIVLRASTHVVFAMLGGLYLRRFPRTVEVPFHSSLKKGLCNVRLQVFNLLVGIIHGLSEVMVITVFYYGGNMGSLYYEKGYLISVLLLVGLGSVIHSMVDFSIAFSVMRAVQAQPSSAAILRKVA